MNKYIITLTILTMFSLFSCKEKENKEPKYVLYQKGEASWYGPGFNGKKTASGETFNMNKLTAAHRTLKFGTIVRVTNLKNNKQVEVVINDRGPVSKSRIIDLSKKAAKELNIIDSGVAKVKIEIKKSK